MNGFFNRYNHSRWRKLPGASFKIQDAHVHFFSHKFYSALAQQKKAVNAEALETVVDF